MNAAGWEPPNAGTMRVSHSDRQKGSSRRRSGNECVENKSHRMNRPPPKLWPFLLPLLPWLTCLLSPSAHAVQTRNFVVSNFYPAHYYGDDTCPRGLNPTPDVFFKRDLKLLGVPQADV